MGNSLDAQIFLDWIKAFPELKAYSKSKLFKIIGPIALGFELAAYDDWYKPTLVIYPLWKETLDECMTGPNIRQSLLDRKGNFYSISNSTHPVVFQKLPELVRAQVPVSFEGDIHLSSLENLANNQFENILVRTNTGEQANLLEFVFYCALCVNDEKKINQTLKTIALQRSKFANYLFTVHYGDFDTWFGKLESLKENPFELIDLVAKNKKHKKIASLHHSVLLPA